MRGIFSRLFRRSDNAEKQVGAYAGSLTTQQLIEHAMYGSLAINSSKAFSIYRRSSAVSTAIDLIAKKVEAIEPVLEIAGEIQPPNEITDFLAKPNPYRMWRQFIGETTRNYLLTGNAYFLGIGSIRTRPSEIYAAHPEHVGPVSSVQDGYPDRYQFAGNLAPGTYVRQARTGDRSAIRFVDGPVRELYHIRDFSTRPSGMEGDSPLESILLEIDQHIAGRQHNQSMLRQGGRLSLLFLIKDWLPKDQFDDLLSRLRAQFGGTENAGKVQMLSHKEMEVKEFGVSNRDMDFVNLDEITKAAICARYNIPLPLITAARQTLSNYSEAILALYDDAVLPVVDVLFEGLSDFILPRFGRDPRRERITFDELAIGPLRQRRVAELKTKQELGVYTINEVRRELPNTDDIEGGDVLLGPATLVPIAGQGIDLAVEHQDDRAATEEARERMEQELEQADPAADSDDDQGEDEP